VLTGIPLFLANRAIGGNGVAGVAAANPAYAEAAAHATILVTAAVIVTTVLAPLLTAWTAKAVGARRGGAPATTTALAE
jgi:2-keto-3-deoxygluconate permease